MTSLIYGIEEDICDLLFAMNKSKFPSLMTTLLNLQVIFFFFLNFSSHFFFLSFLHCWIATFYHVLQWYKKKTVYISLWMGNVLFYLLSLHYFCTQPHTQRPKQIKTYIHKSTSLHIENIKHATEIINTQKKL